MAGKRSIPLGIELVKRGLINENDITTALEYQKTHPKKKLGDRFLGPGKIAKWMEDRAKDEIMDKYKSNPTTSQENASENTPEIIEEPEEEMIPMSPAENKNEKIKRGSKTIKNGLGNSQIQQGISEIENSKDGSGDSKSVKKVMNGTTQAILETGEIPQGHKRCKEVLEKKEEQQKQKKQEENNNN